MHRTHIFRAVGLVIIATGIAGLVIYGRSIWNDDLPPKFTQAPSPPETAHSDLHASHVHDHSGHQHSGHGHAHGPSQASHDSNALSLSAEALRNVGLVDEQIRRVELTTFWQSLTLPAQIVVQSGRTQLQITAPMTGIITHVHVTQGEAVSPGALLFRIRLTHEDLLQLQTDFLKTIGELEVEEREIKRLEELTRSQAVPGQLLLEHEYQRDRLLALRSVQHESLRLHGLSESHLESIASQRRLIQELNIYAPAEATPTDGRGDVPAPDPLVLENLNVHKGQVVSAGQALGILKNYSELYIEGLALQQNIETLRTAIRQKHKVMAVFSESAGQHQAVPDLNISHLANEVDSDSRSIRFFVKFPNRLASDRSHDGKRFVEWTWLIGQRVQLRIPLRRLNKQIVLPDRAVVQEGSENYVFRKHGEHFDRIAIRVRYRDAMFVVVERDGAISPGNEIAWRGARRMQMALRGQTSGPVDPHHGHNH